MSRKWLRAGGMALLLLAGLLFIAFDAPNSAARSDSPPSARVQAVNWRVIDGDTFEDLDTGERYRVENIDTPETGPRAQCRAERELGDRATQRARAHLASARSVDVRRTGRTDRYDRVIAFVLVDGRDF